MLAGIPPYLRFDAVKLTNMELCEEPTGEKFEWVQMILQPFKEKLTGSKFEFKNAISKRESDLKGSSLLLDHIDKLLQIFARCRVYKFYIESYINENTPPNVLSEILQFDAIVRCPTIEVEFRFGISVTVERSLPIEAIGNWLNRTISNGQEHNERFLKLKINFNVPNLGEMFEYLKEVCYFFRKLL